MWYPKPFQIQLLEQAIQLQSSMKRRADKYGLLWK